MFYPDFFEGLTSSSAASSASPQPPPPPPPPPVPEMTRFRSHEVSGATIGSLAGEFVDLMKSGNSFAVLERVTSTKSTESGMSSLVIDGLKFPALHKSDLDWLMNNDDDEDDLDLDDDCNVPPPPVPPPPSAAPIIRRMSSRLLHLKNNKPATTVHNSKPAVVVVHKGKPTLEKPKRQRKVYDVAAHQREYVQYTELDVLCQRGGLGNAHAGNKRYLKAKEAMQVLYQATPKAGRTHVAQQLVDRVREWGGRFLTRDSVGWYEIHNHKARTKASQALREDYTKEELREKRQKYKAALQNAKE